MGKVPSCVDNALIDSFWSSMQSQLLDRQSWTSQVEIASAMFEWIEGRYNPHRRHSSLGQISPTHFEQLDNNLMVAHDGAANRKCPENRVKPQYSSPPLERPTGNPPQGLGVS